MSGSILKKFHMYFLIEVSVMKLTDLTIVQQWGAESVSNYIQWSRDVHSRYFTLNIFEQHFVELASQGLLAPMKDRFITQDLENLV
jgi:hypothetical protein